MRMVKPLSELLAQADALTKVGASAVAGTPSVDSQVDAVVQALEGATQLPAGDYEKVAEAFNRQYVASEIELYQRFQQFEKRALAEGYSPEQVEEALSKVAAKKTIENLPLLVSMGLVKVPKDFEKNRLPAQPRREDYTKRLGHQDLTKSVG